jgi:hypothetical protein
METILKAWRGKRLWQDKLIQCPINLLAGWKRIVEATNPTPVMLPRAIESSTSWAEW